MKPIYNKLSSMPFIFGIARSQKWLVGRKQFLLLSKKSYHENVIDHYENPRNVGSLDKNKKNVVLPPPGFSPIASDNDRKSISSSDLSTGIGFLNLK